MGSKSVWKPFTFIFSLAAILLFSTARQASCEERTVTLAEAFSLAIENHEAVRIASEGVNQARAAVDKATAKILPNITAEGSYTKYTDQKGSGSVPSQPEESSRIDLKLTQPLYSGGRDFALRRQARYLTEKSVEGLASTRESVMRAAARAYYGYLKAGKDLEIKAAALKRAEERSKVASARFRVGEVTKSTVLRAEAEAAGAEAALTKAKGDLKDAHNSLKRVLGMDADIKAVEPEAMKPLGGVVDEMVSAAYGARKDYLQAVLDEKAASEGIKYVKGAFLPSLRLEALYSHKEQSPVTQFFVENSTSGSLVLTYPIFEGGLRKAELSEAKSKLREAELRRLGLKRDIELQVRDSYNDMESVSALMESYRRQQAFAEEDYRMVFEQFKFGLATSVDVIDADTTLISAQRSLMNATYDLQLAIIELKYNMGTLLADAPMAKKEQ